MMPVFSFELIACSDWAVSGFQIVQIHPCMQVPALAEKFPLMKLARAPMPALGRSASATTNAPEAIVARSVEQVKQKCL